jgi:hypothetical protein
VRRHQSRCRSVVKRRRRRCQAVLPIERPNRLRPSRRWVGLIIESTRCLNCHPANGYPTQGDNMHPHTPLITPGPAGKGVPGLTPRRNTCEYFASEYSECAGQFPMGACAACRLGVASGPWSQAGARNKGSVWPSNAAVDRHGCRVPNGGRSSASAASLLTAGPLPTTLGQAGVTPLRPNRES